MNRRDFCSSVTGLAALAAGRSFAVDAAPSQGDKVQGAGAVSVNARTGLSAARHEIPTSWRRSGLIIQRSMSGPGSSVVGDPCIVRDDDIDGWRMFLFFDPPGCGHAICPRGLDAGPGHWKTEGPLTFTNPQALRGSTHKPYVVMDAHRPNHAARINGLYRLLTVSWRDGHKVVQQSSAAKLAGPWTVQVEPIIACGATTDFDAKHVPRRTTSQIENCAGAVALHLIDELRHVLVRFIKDSTSSDVSPHDVSPHPAASFASG